MEALKTKPEQMSEPALSPQQRKLTDENISALSLYRSMFCAEGSLLYYEFCQLFASWVPGLLGYGLRQVLYARLLGSCGKKIALGARINVRHPKRVHFGKKILVDDDVAFFASAQSEIRLGDFVSIGRLSSLVAKDCSLFLDAGVNIGSYCRIASQSGVQIGESTLIAAYCYIGPGNHQIPQSENDKPLIEADMDLRGGVRIGKRVWIGAHSTILDGVEIGDGAIIGAHSLVRENVPPGTIVAGTPAKIIRQYAHQGGS
jgi:acetyltransferase-like isoleucine patch superfamily enzyme